MREPPQGQGPKTNVVSIVGALERKKRERAKESAVARGSRAEEVEVESLELDASIEDLDLDGGIAKLAGEDAPEARVAWAEMRSLRALRSCLRGDVEAGLAEWEEAIAAVPDAPAPYIIRARWTRRHDPAAALADYDRAIAADPRDPSGYARRADCHRQLGDPHRALADYRRAAAIDPEVFDTHYIMGTLLAELGEHKEAVACFGRAIRLAPRYVDFYRARAASREALEDHAGAVRDLDRCLALDPELDELRTKRALCLAKSGDFERSLSDVTALAAGVLEDDPLAADLFVSFGRLLRGLGRGEEALTLFERALVITPDHRAGRAQRARVRAARGDHEGALVDFERLVALGLDDADDRVNHAGSLGALGRMPEAFLAAERAVALSPAHAPAYALRAIYGTHVASTDEALAQVKADLGRAMELAPEQVVYPRKRGEYLIELGCYIEALPDIERALALAPGDAWLHYARGLCKSRWDEDDTLDDDEAWDEPEDQKQERCRVAIEELERAIALGQADFDVHWELVRVREVMGDKPSLWAEVERGMVACPEEPIFYTYRESHRRCAGDLAGADADRARAKELGFHYRDD